MILLWDYYWPVIAAGLVIGLLTCWIALHGRTSHIYFEDEDKRPAYSRSKRLAIFGSGMIAALLIAGLWHGPVGTGSKLAALVEADARAELRRLEMTEIEVEAESGPLRRSLVMTGPANDFQRREVRRLMAQTPGVAGSRWADEGGGYRLPLVLEAALAALIGFLLGALLAYLVVIRRRVNSIWRWG